MTLLAAPALRFAATISEDDERALARRFRAGDTDAGRKIVAGNLKYLVQVASKYAARYGHDVDDLVQEGAVALLNALPHFDPDRGIRLIGFAAHTINKRMSVYGMAMRSTMGSHQSVNRQSQWTATSRELERRLGRQPTAEEVERELGWTEETIAAMRGLLAGVVSLDAPVHREMRGSLADATADPASGADDVDRSVDLARLRRVVAREMGALAPREASVIRERFLTDGDGANLATLGRQLGVSRERVRQIEADALKKLRDQLEDSPDVAPEWVEYGKPVRGPQRARLTGALERWQCKKTRVRR
jgi:RNA polymerase sigma factor (sigma-70 family)